MRHRRLRQRIIAPWPENKLAPADVADRASYVGSAEHKSIRAAGHPALRSDASRCDSRYTDFEQITRVLREGIQRRCTSCVFDGDYPRYVRGWPTANFMGSPLINRQRGNV